MKDKRYTKRLTPESHYEMVLQAEKYLNDDTVPENHKELIRLFAYHGLNCYEIQRSGKVIGKQGPMSNDMIRIWLHEYFPNIEYDETPNRCKRASDNEHINKCRKAKATLLKRAPYCAICGSTENLELDHILTVAAGGNDDLSNLQLLCHACHVDKTMQEDKAFGWREAGLTRGRATHKKRSLKNQEKGEIA